MLFRHVDVFSDDILQKLYIALAIMIASVTLNLLSFMMSPNSELHHFHCRYSV